MNEILNIIKKEQHKRIVCMYYIDEDPIDFIAEQEGLSMTNVRAILAFALREIKREQKAYKPANELIEWNDRFAKGMLRQETRKDCVVCWVCGEVFENISRTHLLKHGITQEEYQQMFPEAMLNSSKSKKKSGRRKVKK
jgi:hypothetical protein